MRIYRKYHCDFGHTWTVMSQQDVPEKEADTFCPEGHEAVTCKEQLPADRVQIVLRPAARITDRVTGTIGYGDRHYLVLLDRADRELCMSKEHYTWGDAVKHASAFKDSGAATALELWNRQGL